MLPVAVARFSVPEIVRDEVAVSSAVTLTSVPSISSAIWARALAVLSCSTTIPADVAVAASAASVMVAVDVFLIAVAVVLLLVISKLLLVTSTAAPPNLSLTSSTMAVNAAVLDLSSRTKASTLDVVTAVVVVFTVSATAATETDPRIRALAPCRSLSLLDFV